MATTQDSLEMSEVSTMTPSELWQRADESLKIIEESLIAQGEPVENLSKSLEGLYQKSQELQESVNALLQRLEYLEEYLIDLEWNMNQAIKTNKASALVLGIRHTVVVFSISASISIVILLMIKR